MSELPAGMLAGCDRLLRADVEPDARGRQRRLMGILLSAPFLGGPVLAISLSGGGPAMVLALLCATVAMCWALALSIALTGSSRFAEMTGLAAAVAAVAAGSAGGGLPVLALSAGVGFSAWWVARGRAAAFLGALAGLVCFPAAAIAARLIDVTEVEPSTQAWLWLAPAALLALALTPVRRVLEGGDLPADRPYDFDPVIDELGVAALKLNRVGEVLAASAAAGRLLGLAPDALVGRPLFDRVHVADRVAYLTTLDAQCDGEDRTILPLRLRVALAGRPGDRYGNFSAELSAAGEHVLVLLREDDASDMRERVSRAEAQAEAVEIAKGRFLATVSHELRTPLNSIIGFSDMLLHGIAGQLADDRQAEYVGLIRESGGHLLSVVNAILDVSKIESGSYAIQAEPFPMKEAVELCRSMLMPQAQQKDINFLVRTRPEVGEVVADRRAVQQIIINLVANAIKFTPSGGKVTVEATRSGGWLKLIVADTGIGMSAEELDCVGQPFTQIRNDLTRQFEGTGLGLSLVKGLVRLHGGELTIESAPGEGTLVTVTLPAAGPSVAAGEMEVAYGGAHEAFRKIA